MGAIADDVDGVLGIVASLPSKRKAKKAAINECHKRGGKACEIGRTFANQCAAVIAGEGFQQQQMLQPKTKQLIRGGGYAAKKAGRVPCLLVWLQPCRTSSVVD